MPDPTLSALDRRLVLGGSHTGAPFGCTTSCTSGILVGKRCQIRYRTATIPGPVQPVDRSASGRSLQAQKLQRQAAGTARNTAPILEMKPISDGRKPAANASEGSTH